MYTPPAFHTEDPDLLLEVMQHYPFATVITCGNGDVAVSHVPVVVERTGGQFTITGHLAAANEHVSALRAARRAHVIFLGPHGYISPRWYVTRPNVPTWNYVAVEASGAVQLFTEAGALLDLLATLTARNEPADGWRFSRDDAWVRSMLPEIVGFRVLADTVTGKLKLNQNRTAEDRANVVDVLERHGDAAGRELAAVMRAYVLD